MDPRASLLWAEADGHRPGASLLRADISLERYSGRLSPWTKAPSFPAPGRPALEPARRGGTPHINAREAQRVKLSTELHKTPRKHTFYILDEPTTGLALSDVHQLIGVLLRLRRNGHTVIVIEHHLDVIKCADWIIDLGPEGGELGGEVVAAGTPDEVAREPGSYTGQHLIGMF